MLRPCFLVIDREQFGSISTRKLVIETAKFNVLTAYSSAEALETLKKFPNVDGVVLDAGLKDIPCSQLVTLLTQFRSDLPIVVVGNSERHPCAGSVQRLESFDPKQLLAVLQKIEPEKSAEIDVRESELDVAENTR